MPALPGAACPSKGIGASRLPCCQVASNIFLTGPPLLKGTPSTIDFTSTPSVATVRLLDTTIACNKPAGRLLPSDLSAPPILGSTQMMATSSAELYVSLLCEPLQAPGSPTMAC